MTKEKNSIFSENNTKRLSVQVSLAGLSFLVTDTTDNTIIFFKDYAFESSHTPEELLEKVKYAYQHNPELNRQFKEVLVIHRNTLFALVPEALFNESKLSDYVKFSSKIFPTDYLDFDSLDTLEIKNVYVPFTNINNYFFDKYGVFTFQHSNTVFIDTIIKKAVNDGQQKIYAHTAENCLDIVVTHNKTIQLCNSFTFKTPEDFIYYILFVAEQLYMNTKEFELFLTGAISEESELYEMAYTYVKNVTILPKSSLLKSTSAIVEDSIFQSHFLLTHS